MKLVFVLFLSCCITVSMQQQSSMYDFWSYMPSWSSWRMPYYNPASYFYGSQQEPHQFVPNGQQVGGWAPHNQQDATPFLPKKLVPQAEERQQQPEGRTPARKQDRIMFEGEPKGLSRINPMARSGFLKLLGLDYLVNYVQSSLSSFTTTSTSTSTLTSTITVGTILTCYTKTMFLSTTACRRKRRLLPGLLIGDDGFESPSQVQSMDTSVTIESLSRETRSAAPEQLNFEIESSKINKYEINEDLDAAQLQSSLSDSSIGRYISQQNRFLTETEYVITTTATTYSLYTTTVTKTVTNIASSTALTCLPACFVLC